MWKKCCFILKAYIKENILGSCHYSVNMKVECIMHHGTLSFPETVCLEDLVPYASKFYNHRPRMIKVRKEGVTLLIFTSMKFRLLGKGDQHVQILHEFLRSLPYENGSSD